MLRYFLTRRLLQDVRVSEISSLLTSQLGPASACSLEGVLNAHTGNQRRSYAYNDAPRWVSVSIKADSNGVTSKAQAGAHTIVIDEPPSLGGTDQGATPVQYFLSSLVGCSQVTLHTCAKELGIPCGHTKWRAEGRLDARGTRGVPGVPARFQAISVFAEIDTNANARQLTQLRDAVEARCPISSTVEASGIEYSVQFKSAFNFQSSMGTHL